MDFHRSEADGHKPVSVLEGEDSNFHRILSREPTIGNSSRHYQYRSPGQIPFQWEMQPGKCKFDPPKRDPIDVPRINPPPITASKSIKLPSRPDDDSGGPKGSSSSCLKTRFWRMIKNKKPQVTMSRSKNQARGSEATSKCSSNGSSGTSSDDNLMSSSSNLSSLTLTSSTTTLCLPFAASLRSSFLAKGHID
ncbi:uncharacterized protein LOC115677495 [Syzygium oleosum]|uniref:uncharacterized protein LOC115677495 n=1 Tax=Syzygium oleosum TaxID=219896 RepID=UPI0024BA36EC|nr:uncharacterized protein LOC115677495 [Syzygium oleosum]